MIITGTIKSILTTDLILFISLIILFLLIVFIKNQDQSTIILLFGIFLIIFLMYNFILIFQKEDHTILNLYENNEEIYCRGNLCDFKVINENGIYIEKIDIYKTNIIINNQISPYYEFKSECNRKIFNFCNVVKNELVLNNDYIIIQK